MKGDKRNLRNVFARNISKMDIFGKFIYFQKISGLDPRGAGNNAIARIIYFYFYLFYLLTSIYIALNFRRNLEQALSAISVINANSGFIMVYFFLFINREEYYSLLAELQDIVDERA